MKEYYSLYEAKEYLTGINKNPISENDVIDMAARGYIRLCLLLDECVVAKFDSHLDNKPGVEIKRFRGYVKIPKNRLTFNHDETISIDSAEVVESYKSEDGMHHVFNSQSKQIISPLSDQKKYKNRYVILPFENGRRLEFEKINIEPQKIRIPAQDLLDFIENRHNGFDASNLNSCKIKPDILKKPKKETIPGKHPSTGAGQCAIKAAWELEQKLRRRPTDDEVMKKLQDWARSEVEPETLISTNKRSVIWLTQKNEKREYSIDALGKALKTWYGSRKS